MSSCGATEFELCLWQNFRDLQVGCSQFQIPLNLCFGVWGICKNSFGSDNHFLNFSWATHSSVWNQSCISGSALAVEVDVQGTSSLHLSSGICQPCFSLWEWMLTIFFTLQPFKYAQVGKWIAYEFMCVYKLLRTWIGAYGICPFLLWYPSSLPFCVVTGKYYIVLITCLTVLHVLNSFNFSQF